MRFLITNSLERRALDEKGGLIRYLVKREVLFSFLKPRRVTSNFKY